jgi:hypothetical protein
VDGRDRPGHDEFHVAPIQSETFELTREPSLLLQHGIDRHQEREDVSVILLAASFGGECDLHFGGFARVGAADLQIGSPVPNRLAAGSVGGEFVHEPVLGAEIPGLFQPVGQKRQYRAAPGFEDEFPRFNGRWLARQRSHPPGSKMNSRQIELHNR